MGLRKRNEQQLEKKRNEKERKAHVTKRTYIRYAPYLRHYGLLRTGSGTLQGHYIIYIEVAQKGLHETEAKPAKSASRSLDTRKIEQIIKGPDQV